MNFKLKLIATSNEGHEESSHEIVSFEKDFKSIEQIGMTLSESKTILKELQAALVGSQINRFIKEHRSCYRCGTSLSTKSHTNVQFKTLFGNIQLSCPRFYHCHCSSKS